MKYRNRTIHNVVQSDNCPLTVFPGQHRAQKRMAEYLLITVRKIPWSSRSDEVEDWVQYDE